MIPVVKNAFTQFMTDPHRPLSQWEPFSTGMMISQKAEEWGLKSNPLLLPPLQKSESTQGYMRRFMENSLREQEGLAKCFTFVKQFVAYGQYVEFFIWTLTEVLMKTFPRVLNQLLVDSMQNKRAVGLLSTPSPSSDIYRVSHGAVQRLRPFPYSRHPRVDCEHPYNV